MSEKKVVKKRFNFKKFLILLLFLYVIGYFIYYLFNLPIKNIVIKGTYNLTDYEIIETAKIKDYPSLFRTSSKTLIKRLNTLDLVKSVEIDKSLTGVLTIDITENKLLFIRKGTDKLVLENGTEIEPNGYVGVATLINYVPEDLYNSLIEGLSKVDRSNLQMISEIEYNSYLNSKGEVIDNERFLLRMNDDNTVYINLMNADKLNHYQEIISSLEDKKGVLYLDSSSAEKYIFTTYESLVKNE